MISEMFQSSESSSTYVSLSTCFRYILDNIDILDMIGLLILLVFTVACIRFSLQMANFSTFWPFFGQNRNLHLGNTKSSMLNVLMILLMY